MGNTGGWWRGGGNNATWLTKLWQGFMKYALKMSSYLPFCSSSMAKNLLKALSQSPEKKNTNDKWKSLTLSLKTFAIPTQLKQNIVVSMFVCLFVCMFASCRVFAVCPVCLHTNSSDAAAFVCLPRQQATDNCQRSCLLGRIFSAFLRSQPPDMCHLNCAYKNSHINQRYMQTHTPHILLPPPHTFRFAQCHL